MSFHDKYIRVNRWWEQAEFEVTHSHRAKTSIVGFHFEDDYISLDIYGNLEVKEDFLFGASGPTWDTKSSREPSCLHDALYYISQHSGFIITYDGHLPNDRAIREEADMLLYTTAIKNGMYKWRAKTWLFFLRKFGDAAWSCGPYEIEIM